MTDSSFTRFKGIKLALTAITKTDAGSNAFRCVTTKSPSLSIKSDFPFEGVCLTLIGSNFSKAGRSVTERKHAIITPNADKLPKSLNTGESDIFIIKKPIAVVTEVIRIGMKLSEILLSIECALLKPFCIEWRMVVMTCTQSATASVITSVGTLTVAVLKNMPAQPESPIVAMTEPMITIKVATTLKNERNIMVKNTKITSSMVGTNVELSSCAAVINA
ncbi:hypothetical protein VME_45450 [Vibrio harveyi 1DA3]|nr:hypothetical protein VME_45450 [Vibrio harveyi 1DA3]